MKFVHMDPMNNIHAFVQLASMSWIFLIYDYK